MSQDFYPCNLHLVGWVLPTQINRRGPEGPGREERDLIAYICLHSKSFKLMLPRHIITAAVLV